MHGTRHGRTQNQSPSLLWIDMLPRRPSPRRVRTARREPARAPLSIENTRLSAPSRTASHEACDRARDRKHPHRHHRGEVERLDATTTRGLAPMFAGDAATRRARHPVHGAAHGKLETSSPLWIPPSASACAFRIGRPKRSLVCLRSHLREARSDVRAPQRASAAHCL